MLTVCADISFNIPLLTRRYLCSTQIKTLKLKVIKSTAYYVKAEPLPNTFITFWPLFFINTEQSGDHEQLLPQVFTMLAMFVTRNNLTFITNNFIAKFSNPYCGCFYKHIQEIWMNLLLISFSLENRKRKFAWQIWVLKGHK